MKLAVITDSSAYLPQHLLHHDDLFILDIPIYIDGESYDKNARSRRSGNWVTKRDFTVRV